MLGGMMNRIPYIERKAAELGYSKAAILKWRQRQVPYKARLEILRAAFEDGIPLTIQDFQAEEGGNHEER